MICGHWSALWAIPCEWNDHGDTGILTIRQMITTFGIDQYHLSFYGYAKLPGIMEQIVYIPAFTVMKRRMNSSVYSVFRNTIKKEITVKEYYPFKAGSQEYSIIKRHFKWQTRDGHTVMKKSDSACLKGHWRLLA